MKVIGRTRSRSADLGSHRIRMKTMGQNRDKSFVGKGVAVLESTDNRKTGPVAVTWVSQASCPADCPFLRSGCYAESGNAGFTTARLNRAAKRSPAVLAREEARGIDWLSGYNLLRLRIVGDCRTNKAAQIVGDACKRYARRGVAWFRWSVRRRGVIPTPGERWSGQAGVRRFRYWRASKPFGTHVRPWRLAMRRRSW